MLLAQFEKPVVNLEDIGVEYFGCKSHTAKQKSLAGLFLCQPLDAGVKRPPG